MHDFVDCGDLTSLSHCLLDVTSVVRVTVVSKIQSGELHLHECESYESMRDISEVILGVRCKELEVSTSNWSQWK